MTALRNLRDLQVLALEGERRGAGRHVQFREKRQYVEHLFREPVAEVFLIALGAHIDKGEYGDGLFNRSSRHRTGFRSPGSGFLRLGEYLFPVTVSE